MGKTIHKGIYGNVKQNDERHLVEIYFDTRPSEDTIRILKVMEWRYFGKNRCWYNRYNQENIKLAIELCGEEEYEFEDEYENEYEDEMEGKIDYYIGPAEILVVTSIRSCINRNHTLIKGVAAINILKNMRIFEVSLPVFYCKKCAVYYVYENDFNEIKKQGVVCVHVLTVNEYRKVKNNGWEPKSIMRSFGYTVNSKDNYSETVRRRILAFLIENNILSVPRIADYLAWFIRTHRNMYNMEQAIEKWDSDRKFVLSYIPGSFRIKVRDIYIKKYIDIE